MAPAYGTALFTLKLSTENGQIPGCSLILKVGLTARLKLRLFVECSSAREVSCFLTSVTKHSKNCGQGQKPTSPDYEMTMTEMAISWRARYLWTRHALGH